MPILPILTGILFCRPVRVAVYVTLAVLLFRNMALSQSKKDDDVKQRAPQSFSITMEVLDEKSKSTSKFEFAFHRSGLWYSRVQTAGQAQVEFFDGSHLWSYEDGGTKLYKLDVKKLMKSVDQRLVKNYLRNKLFPGIVTPFDATDKKWGRILGVQEALNQFQNKQRLKIGERQEVLYEIRVDGASPMFRVYFDNNDHILRKQILYDPTGREWISWRTVTVKRGRKVNRKLFRVRNAKGKKIVDETSKIVRELKKQGMLKKP